MKIIACLLALAPFAAGAEANLCLQSPAHVASAFFYHIQRGAESGHILGTMHAGVPLRAMPSEVIQAIDQATAGVGEIFEADVLRHFWNGLKFSAYTHGRRNLRLAQLLGPDDYALLRETFRRDGLDPDLAGSLSPAGAIVALNYQGAESLVGQLDNEIEARLKENGRPRWGLELEASHLDLMHELFTLAELREELHSPDLHAEVCRFYWTGDEATVREEAAKIDPNNPATRRLLIERNQAWIPRIEQILRRTPRPFFYFGVAHLYGDYGVLHLLEQRGFTITRVGGSWVAK